MADLLHSEKSTAQLLAGAARAVCAVVRNKRTIDWVLLNKPEWTVSPVQRALLFDVIRHYYDIEPRVSAQLRKELRGKDQDIFALLLVGAYQLLYKNMPPHAAINEAVSAVGSLRKPWAKGLVNAVMRKLSTSEKGNNLLERSFGNPDWLCSALQADYPGCYQALLAANNTRAPMVLRVNPLLTNRSTYIEALRAAAIACREGTSPQAVILEQPMQSSKLPGWSQGQAAVQDMGAQYAAHLLHNEIILLARQQADAPLNLLDACAAPGGKLAHLLELIASHGETEKLQLNANAIDISEARLKSTRAILTRLGHSAHLRQGNAGDQQWWDGRPYQAILLDAPCSGTGTIRRHPDIRLLLDSETIAEHAHLQLAMLNNLWQTLAPGGTLLYCTCSVLQAENDTVIDRFLEQNNKHAHALTFDLPSGMQTRHGWQLLPTNPDTDGFYYALLRKR